MSAILTAGAPPQTVRLAQTRICPVAPPGAIRESCPLTHSQSDVQRIHRRRSHARPALGTRADLESCEARLRHFRVKLDKRAKCDHGCLEAPYSSLTTKAQRRRPRGASTVTAA